VQWQCDDDSNGFGSGYPSGHREPSNQKTTSLSTEHCGFFILMISSISAYLFIAKTILIFLRVLAYRCVSYQLP